MLPCPLRAARRSSHPPADLGARSRCRSRPASVAQRLAERSPAVSRSAGSAHDGRLGHDLAAKESEPVDCGARSESGSDPRLFALCGARRGEASLPNGEHTVILQRSKPAPFASRPSYRVVTAGFKWVCQEVPSSAFFAICCTRNGARSKLLTSNSTLVQSRPKWSVARR